MRPDRFTTAMLLFLFVFSSFATVLPHLAQADDKCGVTYPCRLRNIIDRSDWPPVLTAITAEMHRLTGEHKENWSSAKNSHSGYVQLSAPKSSAPVCREFEVVSYMGKDSGKEKVTACQQRNGTVTVK